MTLNKQHLIIVDIQETNTFEICIPWCASREWLLVQGATTGIENWTDYSATTEAAGYVNGFIWITPFTQLVGPTAADIYVNIYASCDNLQVNGFSRLNMPARRRIPTESGVMNKMTESKPVSCFEVGEMVTPSKNICNEYFGEQPLTFRSLLKRYATLRFDTLATSASGTNRYATVPFPLFDFNNLDYGASSDAAYIELFSYLRYAYLGMRGGIRYRLYGTFSTPGIYGNGRLTLQSPSSTDPAVALTTVSSSLAPADIEGSTLHIVNICPNFEAEFPFYSSNLFMLAFAESRESSVSGVFESVYYRSASLDLSYATSTALTSPVMQLDVAAGEDFNFIRFQGAPYFSITN